MKARARCEAGHYYITYDAARRCLGWNHVPYVSQVKVLKEMIGMGLLVKRSMTQRRILLEIKVGEEDFWWVI